MTYAQLRETCCKYGVKASGSKASMIFNVCQALAIQWRHWSLGVRCAMAMSRIAASPLVPRWLGPSVSFCSPSYAGLDARIREAVAHDRLPFMRL